MSEFTSGNVPGVQPATESQEVQLTWTGRRGQDLVATRAITLDAAATDGGNVPTTTLRGGSVLARQDANGKLNTYDGSATDGRQIAAGVLEQSQNMLVEGTASDRFTQMLVIGMVKESQLVGLDTRGRQQLAGRLFFDRDTTAVAGALMHPRGIYRKSANYTVLSSDHNLLLLATAAVTFTLPTKANGLAFRFAQTADADLIIAGSSDLVHKGSVDGSQVQFTTAGQKIGSQVLVECVYIAADTLKWLVTNLGGTTATVA
jgi:hypothetical protein